MTYEPETMAGAHGWPGTPEGLGRPGQDPVDAPELAPGDVVQCRCGRWVQAQMMVRVSALPEDVRGLRRRWVEGAGGRPAVVHEPSPAYLCDGCRETLFRTGKIKRSEFARAVGAPEAVVAKLEETET